MKPKAEKRSWKSVMEEVERRDRWLDRGKEVVEKGRDKTGGRESPPTREIGVRLRMTQLQRGKQ